MSTILSIVSAKKKYLIIGIVLIFLLIGKMFLLSKPSTELTYTVRKESLVDTVQVSGTYTTAAQTEVASPAKGIITELYVANNDEVNKGDPLFRVESTATEQEKTAAYADYQNAVNNVKTAKQAKEAADAAMWTEHTTLLDARNNQKYKNENSQNLSTKKDYTDLEKQSIDASVVQAEKDFRAAETKYKESDIAVAAKQAEFAKATLAYNATQNITVKAPATGRVVNLQKNVGDKILTAPASDLATLLTNPSGATTTSSTPVLIITDPSNPAITTSVNESSITRITPGQKATIVFDGLKDQTFAGTVASVDEIGTNKQGVITYTARIESNRLPSTIKPNMTAIITIETLRKDNILAVPNSAIITRDGKTYIQQANTKENNLIEVTLGTKGITKTEIVSGVAEGIVVKAIPDQTK